MAIDAAVLIVDFRIRWLLSLIGMTAVAAALWFYVLRPLSRRISPFVIARWLEQRHPEFEERLSTALQLLGKDDSDPATSEVLLQELAAAAETDAEQLVPRREFSAMRTLKPCLIAAVTLALIGSTFLFWPASASRLVERAVKPGTNLGNAFSSGLEIRPGDQRIAAGDPLTRSEERRVGKD